MIADIIKPIQLLKGSHEDTAKTGSGCFMNVIAYLNGEPQITDASTCVCVTIRQPVIWFNDWLKDDERHELIPYIERAMGSATDDQDVMKMRLAALVKFANEHSLIAAKYASDYAVKYAEYAAKYASDYAKHAAKYASDYAEYVTKYAVKYAEYAAKSAKYAAEYAEYAAKSAKYRNETKHITFEFLETALPKAKEPTKELIQRANELVAL
jgi:hypothetical protein